ncbi:hypothetical protein Tco_0879313 [Tanacetum coccineum]
MKSSGVHYTRVRGMVLCFICWLKEIFSIKRVDDKIVIMNGKVEDESEIAIAVYICYFVDTGGQTDAEQRRPTIKKLEVKQVEFKLGEDCWDIQDKRSKYC